MKTLNPLEAQFDKDMFLRLRNVHYGPEVDGFEAEFEDGLTHIECHDEIREANKIAPKAKMQRVEIEKWFRRGFIIHYDNGQTAEVELMRNMMIELPVCLTIGSHKCAIRDRTLTIDDASYKIPMRDDEVERFCLWLNNTVIPDFVKEANGDRGELEQIPQFVEYLERMWDVTPRFGTKRKRAELPQQRDLFTEP